MIKVELELKNQAGLHARPASLFVKEASKYLSDINVIKDGKEYNAKSIMGILSMATGQGDKLVIVAEGSDEKKAIEGLKSMVESNFGE